MRVWVVVCGARNGYLITSDDMRVVEPNYSRVDRERH